MARIAIIYYSTYGHIATLAKKVLEGANAVEGVTAELYQVPETLTPEILTALHAPPKDDTVPIIDVAKLPEFDGFIFGFPTRFGTIPAQFKAFLDATGSLWAAGSLVGKGAAIFTSTGTQGGGSETTVLTTLPVLAHHGLIFIPTGYSYGASLYSNDAVRGGTAYGKYVAGVVKKLAA